VYLRVLSRTKNYWKGEVRLPLTKRVSFKTILQKNNRVQIPRLVRTQYKLEPFEVLKVTASVTGLVVFSESFFARIQKGGRIVIPKLTLDLLRHDEPSLEGYAIEVTLEPA
jgi:bifunctional DNA-binding transcriptional regulator/antitoxin component of YhaV-PrlF toxin-antitoxin module